MSLEIIKPFSKKNISWEFFVDKLPHDIKYYILYKNSCKCKGCGILFWKNNGKSNIYCGSCLSVCGFCGDIFFKLYENNYFNMFENLPYCETCNERFLVIEDWNQYNYDLSIEDNSDSDSEIDYPDEDS